MDFLKLEENKSTTSAKVEGRYLKLGDYRFALSKESGDDQRVIRISMEEIQNLNDKYEVSTSILDFVLQSKHDEFMKKGVKVLPTRVLRDIMGSAQNKGQILQDAARGSVFDHKALVLPFVSEDRWDLFVLFNPRILFNQGFQKLSPNVADLVQTLVSSSKKKKKKKKNIKARLAHISSNLSESGDYEDKIYQTLNAHFEVVFPGENIETYLSSGSKINADNCLFQPLTIKHKEENTGTSGGYLIYSFLSQVFLKDKSITPDIKNIEFANWFSNIDSELDQIKHQLKEIPGTKIVEKDGQVTVTKRDSFFLNTPERCGSAELVSPLKLESVKPFLEQEANAIKKEDVITEDGPEESERDISQVEISKENLANVIDIDITDELKTKEEDKAEEVKKEEKVIEFEDPFAYDDEPKAKAPEVPKVEKPQTPPPSEEPLDLMEKGDEFMKSETCPPGMENEVKAALNEDPKTQVENLVESAPDKDIAGLKDAYVDELPTKPQTPPPSEEPMIGNEAEFVKSVTSPAGLENRLDDLNQEMKREVNVQKEKIAGVEDAFVHEIPTKIQTPPPSEEQLNSMLENEAEFVKSETSPAGLKPRINELDQEMKKEVNVPLETAPMLQVEDAFADEIPAKPQTPPLQDHQMMDKEQVFMKSETCPPGMEGMGSEGIFQNRVQLSNEDLLKSDLTKDISETNLKAQMNATIPADNATNKLLEESKNQQLTSTIPTPAKPEVVEEVGVDLNEQRDSQKLLESSAPEVAIDSGLGIALDKGDGMLEYEMDGQEAAHKMKLKGGLNEPRVSQDVLKKEEIDIQIDRDGEHQEGSPKELYHELISEQISKEVHLPQDQDFSIPFSASVENNSGVQLTQERFNYGDGKDGEKPGQLTKEETEEFDRSSTPSPRKSIGEVTSQIKQRLKNKGINIQPSYEPAKLLDVEGPYLHRTPSEEKLSRLEKATPGLTIKTDSSYLSPPPKKKIDMEKRKQRGEISYDDHYQRKAGCCSGCSIF